MKKIYSIILLVLCQSIIGQASWNLTNSINQLRYDDLFFISPDTGWAVGANIGSSGGIIFKTTDGGDTWINKKSTINYPRSIEFANKNLGFVGCLSSSGTNIFYKTLDGGNTWADISSSIASTGTKGVCGICCVNNNVTYAVGVYATPAYVLKTIDGGLTWSNINMGAHARALVDVQFTDVNNGFVTGMSKDTLEGGIILKTNDGGTTWTKVYTSNRVNEYIWKIQNLDNVNWYASVENGFPYFVASQNYFLRSTNGGLSWNSKPVSVGIHLQGIGFMDTLRGWTGGDEFFETIDGGNTWTDVSSFYPNRRFDRFQRVNANTAYFSASKVYKLSNPTKVIEYKKPKQIQWLQVFPNPTKNQITYILNLPNKTMFVTRLFNTTNQLLYEYVEERTKGQHKYTIPLNLNPGIYFLYIMYNEKVECEKIIIE